MIIKELTDEIAGYLVDASNYKGNCEKVYIPESTNEVAPIVKECYRKGIPIHVSGMGTGLTGGRVPENGVVISTEKLCRIVTIDIENYVAEVECGVILEVLHGELDKAGLYFPPDPTEQNSSIGGNISNNASGAKTFKYGPTRDYVLGLKIILPDGEAINLRRGEVFEVGGKITFTSESGKNYFIPVEPIKMPETKNAAGYFLKKGMDAVDLFIGSEGTLGFILSAELKLLNKPEQFISFISFFEYEADALRLIEKIRAKSKQGKDNIDALGIEFFDSNSLEFLRDNFPRIPQGRYSAVWIEQEVTTKSSDSIMEKYLEILEDSSADLEKVWFATSGKERKEFQEFRHAVSWKVNDFITRNNIQKVGTDLAVPVENFLPFYQDCKDAVKDSGLDYLIYGHFGNCHIHLNMLPKEENFYKTAKSIYAELCKKAVFYGGTISAEHGIGKIKREYLKLLYNKNEIDAMRGVKKTLDPKNLFSPGNIFSDS